MGEMTLNNSKPRRGRKPKKADICHLIYENYGTVVPGQPPPPDRTEPGPPPREQTGNTKTDLQNKIISSLLERKLSQENKRRLETLSPQRYSPDEPPLCQPGPLHSDVEPLNLCIRDLRDLKIQIQKKFGNIYSSLPEVKTELEESAEDETSKPEQPNAISVIQRNTNVAPPPAGSPPSPRGPPPSPGGWPPLYVHPLALQTQLLYYQRLAGRLPFDEPSPSTNSLSEASESSLEESKSKLVLKQISELLDPKVIERGEEAKRSPERKMKRASPDPGRAPVKRKRSAIFIPPVPPKSNSTTPTTEVSICKFKFTGGSKPSLQEKKMLSVDSGGNFRYYSGTGNKGSRGPDYLPGRNRTPDVGESSAPKEPSKEDVSKKKRKSRKSLQREKLEQTFKEKGFLIQTQQLQSAEGATYCKFRQLRKFTRYLFRSWKDYLPGELEERPTETSAPVEEPTGGEWG